MKNLRMSAVLAAALLLVLVGGVSLSRAEENKNITLVYTGEFRGQLLPKKG